MADWCFIILVLSKIIITLIKLDLFQISNYFTALIVPRDYIQVRKKTHRLTISFFFYTVRWVAKAYRIFFFFSFVNYTPVSFRGISNRTVLIKTYKQTLVRSTNRLDLLSMFESIMNSDIVWLFKKNCFLLHNSMKFIIVFSNVTRSEI